MKKLILLLLLISGVNAMAQELKLETGTEFGYQVQLIDKGTYPNDQQYTFHFKVLGKDASQNYKLSCTLVRIKTKTHFSKDYVYTFNSDELRKTNLNSTAALLPFALLQQPFTIAVSPKGKVVKFEGIDTLINKAVIRWNLGKARETELQKNAVGFPANNIQELFLALPETKIALNSEWTSAAGNSRFIVTGIKGALLLIKNTNIPGKALSLNNNGIYNLNTATGLLESAEYTRKGTVPSPSGPAQIDQSFSQKLLHTVKGSTPVDTAWMNMAVKLSSWSKALKKTTDYDSVKVFNFFAVNDPAFQNDPYYADHKLTLIQQFRSNGLNSNYTKQLLKTPNILIADNHSHLHNKLGDVLALSADSAYDVARYLYKSPSFTNWLQHSYAQHFIRPALTDARKAQRERMFKKEGYSDEEIARFYKKSEAELVNTYKLLELLINDKDPVMQHKIHPLYLWVKAKQDKSNAEHLIKTASALKKLDEPYIKEGNGARYNLLVYKLLNDVKETGPAQSLLNHTIKQLEKLSADTLNAEKYAHQNLLAGAYYYKYLSEKPVDSVKALAYLSKAAEYSPKSAKESAHVSFYDRVLLGTKDSYRKEFLTRLFNTGNKEEALKVFTVHLNANPADLKEMAALYESNFPGKEFRQFFTDNVIASWDLAPQFLLKGVKGEQYALKDYANKWLLLDFWGTWCSPCRKEMPQINKFNAQLKDGKHKNLQFLSIACRDTENNVNSYFSSNNYDMPAAISDNQVEKSYKINGYPSKIIIAPNGRMLPIKFQQDWQAIATSFAQLMAKE